MFVRHLAAALLLWSLATASLAQQASQPHKWYVDLGVGESTLDHESGFTEVDDRDTSYSLRIGYRFTRFFALEAGYIDIGDFSSSIIPSCGAGPCPPSIRESSSIDGWLLNSRFIWPVARHFQLNASLGALYPQRNTTVAVTPGDTYGDSYENGGFSYGFGVAVPINDRFEIGLDFTQYFELGFGFDFSSTPSIQSDSDARVIALDLRLRF